MHYHDHASATAPAAWRPIDLDYDDDDDDDVSKISYVSMFQLHAPFHHHPHVIDHEYLFFENGRHLVEELSRRLRIVRGRVPESGFKKRAA